MGKLSNGQIERLAIDAIRSEANRPEACLLPEISEGDKRVSFDGEISVFEDSSGKIETFLGKVPVQVKGKQVEIFTEGIRTFSLSLKHFRNYYRHSGVLLFVVEIKEEGQVKIFYKHLLPKELSSIMKVYSEKKKQGSRRVELRSLQETNLKDVCRKFLSEQKLQPLTLIESSKYQEESFERFGIHSLTYEPSNEATNNLFEHDFILYGIDKDVMIPLNLGRISVLRNTSQEELNVDGKTHKFITKNIIKEHVTIREFDDALRVIYDNETYQVTFTLLNFVSVAVQIRVLAFLKDFFSESHMEENLDNFRDPKVIKWIEDVNHLHSLMLDVQKIYKSLNIPEDVIIKQIDPHKSIYEQFEHLVELYHFNKMEGFSSLKNDISRLINYRVGDKLFILYYQPLEHKKIVDAFNPAVSKIELLLSKNDIDEIYKHSFYIQLDKNSLSFGLNVDFQMLKDSFDDFDPYINEVVSPYTNTFYLRCINAYDVSNRTELLDIAEHILKKYYKSTQYNPSSIDAAIVKINELQILARRVSGLSEGDFEELISIKNRFSFNEWKSLHFSCNVLLGNKIEARYAFQKLGNEKQNDLQNYPIYYLYNQLCQETEVV
ncbi:hypothetical protein JI735_02035 [Paenibacillus sonchi]|uniref:DUF4365 domain-containing protein n=1 Tax=Paenibacillus sonchi TaxID=373687 RepID=A0A974PE19_9BACL|nr:hypothetical protein [Paenibacillus sonchi]QQZ61567.1 hypothetical protein JI735_02035 [Paenibacillus sonchi]